MNLNKPRSKKMPLSDRPNNKKNTAKLGRPKSEEKRLGIMAAAEKLILELGYSATTMDLVASQAQVSKQTVYSHFSNKESLFTAIIVRKCREFQVGEPPQDASSDVFATLYKIGLQIVRLLQREEVVAMYRVVIAEVSSNPQVAELFYNAGPHKSMQMIADYLLSQKQLALSRAESHSWAMVFLNMLKGDFHFRSILGLPYALDEAAQQKLVTNAVNHLRKLLLSD